MVAAAERERAGQYRCGSREQHQDQPGRQRGQHLRGQPGRRGEQAEHDEQADLREPADAFREAPGRRPVREPGVTEEDGRGVHGEEPARPRQGRGAVAGDDECEHRDRVKAGSGQRHATCPAISRGDVPCTACTLSRVTPSTDSGSLSPDSPSSMPLSGGGSGSLRQGCAPAWPPRWPRAPLPTRPAGTVRARPPSQRQYRRSSAPVPCQAVVTWFTACFRGGHPASPTGRRAHHVARGRSPGDRRRRRSPAPAPRRRPRSAGR